MTDDARGDASWLIRPTAAADGDFIVDTLVAAFNWSPDSKPLSRERILAMPEIAKYVDGWPRATDLSVVAVAADAGRAEAADGELAGAAWLRFFTADAPGYGFVAPDVPELTIGVTERWRGRGVGRALMRDITSRARTAGIRQISLSVERKNYAQRLYLSEGFRIVDDTGRDSDTMLKDI